MTDIVPTPNSAPSVRGHYKISGRLDRALREYVANGGVIAKAAQAVGMRRESLSRALQRQHVNERVEELVREAKQRTGLKALARIDHLIDGARSEYVQLEAAKTAADRAGHAPPKDQQVQDTTLIVNIKID